MSYWDFRQSTMPHNGMPREEFTAPLRTRTHDDSPSLLDPDEFPGVVTRILAECDHPTRETLGKVNRALFARVTGISYRHFVSGDFPFCTGDGTDVHPLTVPVPREDEYLPYVFHLMRRHTRILDLEGYCPLMSGLAPSIVAAAPSATTLRVPSFADLADLASLSPLPPTLVIKLDQYHPRGDPKDPNNTDNGDDHITILPPAIPGAVTRLIVNIAYLVPHLLAFGNVPPLVLPDAVKELVIHLRYFHQPEYPRYVKIRNHDVVCSYRASAPIPHVARDEFLDVLPGPVPPPAGEDLWARLADLYAAAVGKGKRRNRALKLTLVGLDEFDEARAAEDDSYAEFVANVHTLPWGGGSIPRPRPTGRHEPVAPGFVDSVLALVHKGKHERVRKYVRVLTDEEYLAEIGDGRRYEEDWWSYT